MSGKNKRREIPKEYFAMQRKNVMTKKSDNRRKNRKRATASSKMEWTGTPNALAQLSQALLAADTLEDVLHASLEIILPTDINGVAILLADGPPDDRYLETVATWGRDGHPAFAVGTRFNNREHFFQPLLTVGQSLVMSDLGADERASEPLRSTLLQAEVRALAALPLGAAKRPSGTDQDYVGVMLVDRAEARPFSPESIHLYEEMAALATGAIERLWLIQKTQQSLTKALGLYEISCRLSESQSTNDILQTVLDSELFDAAGGTIALLEPSASASPRPSQGVSESQADQELVFWAAAGAAAENILGMRMPVSEGVIGWVVRENKPALVPDAYADERFYRQMDTEIAYRTRSILCAPLRVEGRVIGAIELVDVHQDYLNKEGLRLLDQVAQQAALFVENQRLLAETQRQAQDLSLLLEAGHDLTSTLDRGEALDLITSRALDLVEGETCDVYLLHPDPRGERVLMPVASSSDYAEQILDTPIKLDQGISGRVAQSGVGEIANRVDLDPRGFQVPGTPHEPENLISVPLISEGRVMGVMTISRLGEEGFVEQDLRIVSALAGQAATVLENTRLFAEARQRSRELAAINAVVSTAGRSLTLDEILIATLGRIAQVMPNSASLICLIDQTTGELELSSEHNLPTSLAQRLRQKGMKGTLCELTVNRTRAYYVPDLTDDLLVDTSGLVNVGLRTYLGTPLIARGQPVGTLGIFATEPDAFTPADTALLTAIGQHVGVAVRNAQLYQQTERALADSTAFQEASQAISKAREPEEVLQNAVTHIAEHIGADQCQSVLFDETLGYGQVKAQYRPTPGIKDVYISKDSLPYEILRNTGQPIVIEDISTHPIAAQLNERLTNQGVKSLLLVPLIIRGHLIGSIDLSTMHARHAFTEAEISFCRTLADRAAIALDNRRLFTQAQETIQDTTMLYQANRALTQAHDLQDVLHAILDNLPIQQIDQCLIALFEPDADPVNPSIEVMAIWDHEGDESLLGMHFTPRELPVITQPSTIETLVINDLEDETRLDSQSITTLQALNVKSALIVPLETGGMLLGWLLLITHHQTHLFDPDQVRPYQTLADQAAVVIKSQQLLQQVQASLEEIETVHRQYLREEWTSFLQSKETQAAAIAYDQGTLLPAQDHWHSLIGEAVSQGAPVTYQHSELGEEEPKVGTGLVTPLKVRGQVIGALGLEDPDADAAHEWTADQLSMVQEIADQVALAIENARLLDTTQASLAETARLYEATGRLSSPDSANEVIKVLTQEIHTALGPAFGGSILRTGPDPAGHVEWFELNTQWSPTEGVVSVHTRLPASAYPTLSSFVGQKEPLIVRDTQVHPEDEHIRNFLTQLQVRAITIIPLISGDSWLGMINITCQEERTPDERTIRFLQSLADRAAVALESIRLYEETQRRAVQLEAASKVSRAATSILEQDKLLPSVVELIRDHFNFYHAQVFLVDPTEHWAILAASTGETGQKLLQRGHVLEIGGSSTVGIAISTGEPQIAHDSGEDPAHLRNELLPDTRSEMAIPLRIGGRLIGALDVQSTEPTAFSPDDVSVLSTLADQLATAIENARLYQNQLQTAEKLREVDRLKTQFLANMSHELRTPLNSIIGFSRVILKEIDGPISEMQKQDLTAIYNSGQHLLALINNMLDLSKIEAGKMDLLFKETDLTETINSVLATATALTRDKPAIELRHTIAPDLPLIIADATRVRQVLLNLIGNAAKFTERGHIELSVAHDARFVTIKVSDTGIGIPSDKFHTIFQEFEQVDASTTRPVGGTGLGLPISRYFVEMHGGRIRVESQVGVGSTFVVQLPIKGPQASEEAEEELIPAAGERLILSVDDDDDVIKMYRRYLEKQNYRVIGLSESKQVVQTARELRPYAILLDLLMPEKDGWTVIRELKANPETKDIPVIICSIVSDTGYGFSLGAADYLVKPILEEQLLDALARLDDSTGHSPGELRRVLIIDDSPEDRLLLRRTIESASGAYQVLEASGGLEGISIIQQQRPDLVVLDLMMPEMDGFAVLETLKSDEEMRQTPIIIVTAKELTEQERTQLNGRIAALLQKGLFNENELLQDINLALRRVRQHI
jgi:GAF domain-containing protein/CheY-like chemotaxis protein/anti-sigma regulatory factor (Ser/Thr protein kinase)